MRYDVAIIGTGPAGLSAALNAVIRKKSIIIFGSEESSAKLTKASHINNFLGSPAISGKELKENFIDHIKSMNIEITNSKVTNVYAMGEYYALMVNNEMIEAKTVILTTGVEFGKPLTNEEKFLGRGVSYCATCDAALYAGKTVAVIGYNHESVEEANFLSEVVGKVYFIKMFKDEAKLNPNIELVQGKPVEITGDSLANSLKLDTKTLDVDGIFILRDSVSAGTLVPGIQMDKSHIVVDRTMSTNLPGCFAAGDITGAPYQYMKACGEGLVAALSAVSYLDKLK